MDYLDDLHRLAGRGLSKGGKLKLLTRFEWDVSGSCTNPKEMTRHSRPSPKKGRTIGVNNPDKTMTAVPMTAVITVRCRKCEKCRRFHAMHWIPRIRYEISQAQRTWFLTLTLAPQAHFMMLCEARRDYDLRGGGQELLPDDVHGPEWDPGEPQRTFETLSPDQQFEYVCRYIYREVQKMFKRIRKKNQAVFKYVVVFEKHTDKLAGLPHIHILIHERSGVLLHKDIVKEWTLGVTNCKLVRDEDGYKAPFYITKYLTKGAASRIRGSEHYGKEPPLLIEGRREQTRAPTLPIPSNP